MPSRYSSSSSLSCPSVQQKIAVFLLLNPARAAWQFCHSCAEVASHSNTEATWFKLYVGGEVEGQLAETGSQFRNTNTLL